MNEKIFTVHTTNNFVKYYKLHYLAIGHIWTDFKRKLDNFYKVYGKLLNIKVLWFY